MKHLLFLIFLSLFSFIITAQEKSERITIKFGLSHPVLNERHIPNSKFTIDPEIEVLLNFRIYETIKLSAGIGIQTGEHHRIEEVNHLIWVEDIGWVPTEYTNRWKLNFSSIEFPVYFEDSLNNFFMDSFIAGTNFGWIWKHDLSEHAMPDVSHIKINRYFMDFCFGLQKQLYRYNNLSFGLSPFIGYRGYLSDSNNWQKGYFFYQMKFNVNL